MLRGIGRQFVHDQPDGEELLRRRTGLLALDVDGDIEDFREFAAEAPQIGQDRDVRDAFIGREIAMHARHGEDPVRGDGELAGRFRSLDRPALQVEQARDQLQAVHGAMVYFAGQEVGARGGVDGSAPQLEPVGDECGQRREVVELAHVGPARPTVDHAQRPEVISFGRRHRSADEEAESQFAPDHRLHGRNGGPRTPAHFRCVDAVVRLEPQPVGIEEADDRDGGVEQARGQRRDAVEGDLGGRVENVVALQHLETARFVVRSRLSGRRRGLDEVQHGCPLARVP